MNTLTRRSLVIATAMVATAGLSGCSSGSSAGIATSLAPAATAPEAAASADAASGLVGPGCAAYAAANPSGAASVAGMSTAPVAVAASGNPLLKTLTAAVSGKLNKGVNLVDTLDSSEFTVFAPVDSAFAKLPASTVSALSKSKNRALLTKILTYHVVAGQLDPSAVVGTQKTVEGGSVKVTGSGDTLKVNGAHVVCGGVKTANATVYLIDGVLTPPKK